MTNISRLSDKEVLKNSLHKFTKRAVDLVVD